MFSGVYIMQNTMVLPVRFRGGKNVGKSQKSSHDRLQYELFEFKTNEKSCLFSSGKIFHRGGEGSDRIAQYIPLDPFSL